jgi:hypothetical protein
MTTLLTVDVAHCGTLRGGQKEVNPSVPQGRAAGVLLAAQAAMETGSVVLHIGNAPLLQN